MGQDQGKAESGVSIEAGWKGYEQQLKNSRKSDVNLYYEHQIRYLEGIFLSLDVKGLKSIELHQMDEIFFLKQHPLYERIRTLFGEEMKKLKVKRISLDIMLHLFSVFHIMADIQLKYKYLFRLYDWDKDFKLSGEDLVSTFQIMFRSQAGGNNYGRIVYSRQSFQCMANEVLLKHGLKGEIKFENFRDFIPEDQVKEIMTFRFNGTI